MRLPDLVESNLIRQPRDAPILFIEFPLRNPSFSKKPFPPFLFFFYFLQIKTKRRSDFPRALLRLKIESHTIPLALKIRIIKAKQNLARFHLCPDFQFTFANPSGELRPKIDFPFRADLDHRRHRIDRLPSLHDSDTDICSEKPTFPNHENSRNDPASHQNRKKPLKDLCHHLEPFPCLRNFITDSFPLIERNSLANNNCVARCSVAASSRSRRATRAAATSTEEAVPLSKSDSF